MADHSNEGGTLPDVHDEAADTPMWVPMLGLALLTLATIFLIVRAAVSDDAVDADVTVQVAD